ncbi:MAG: hypothetical protein AAF670_15765, partial [Planctomycetota bacterium]
MEVTADEIDSSDGFSLREAMIAAHAFPDADEVTINLQAGQTYKLRTGGEFGDFEIRRDLTINGNGATIDGDFATRLFEVHQQEGGVDVVFQNITLREGKATGGAVRIANVGGSVTFINSTLEDNLVQGVGDQNGGAINVVGGSLIIDGTTLRNNQADALRGETAVVNGGAGGWARGGAISADRTQIIIRNGSVFQGNDADAGDGGTGDDSGGPSGSGRGGAIYLMGASSLEISDSEFIDNQARGGLGGNARGENAEAGHAGHAEGGAIFLGAAVTSVAIEDSSFLENIARANRGGHATNSDGDNRARAGDGGDARGGAIHNEATTLTIIDTEFSGNEALAGEGGDSDRGNSGDGGNARGGAIDLRPGTTTVNIQGSIIAGDGENLFADATYTTLFSANIARGGDGGEKTDTDEDGGNAGNGGSSLGGAINQSGSVELTIDGVILIGNIADGGFGGHGASSASGCGDDICQGTAGGNNGFAEGGAIRSGGTLTVSNSSIVGNLAAGGLPVEGGRVAAGLGGFKRDGTGLLGGNGGHAFGGGIYVNEASLTVTGSGFSGNSVLGGLGGGGGHGLGLDDDENAHGRQGGRGGDARGGAIAATLTQAHQATLERVIVVTNTAVAGAGGPGGDAAQGGEVDDQSNGGRGGDGGNASGGGISLINWSDNNTSEVLISEATISNNTLVSGDGGAGGRGGIGDAREVSAGIDDDRTIFYPGGDGGDGGNGGLAYGGGVFLRSADAEMNIATIDSNVVSSGFGGRGGDGGSGVLFRDDITLDDENLGTSGGDGGDGGDARLAAGGGIAVQGGFALIVQATIVDNVVIAGGGGVGGYGAPGREFGGDGGDGGNGANARGGGIAVIDGGADNGSVNDITVFATTIARNTVNAGPAGLAGSRGEAVGNDRDARREQSRMNSRFVDADGQAFPFTSTAVFAGVSAGIDPAFDNPTPQSLDVLAPTELLSDNDLGSLSDLRSDAAVATGIVAGGAAVGGGAFLVGGLGTGAFVGFAIGAYGASVVSGLAIGAGLGIGAGVGVLAIGVAISVKVIIAVASGDSFQEGLESALGIDVNDLSGGVNFGAFFAFGGGGDFVEPTPRAPGRRGSDGLAGVPRGPGIDGGVTSGRSIIATNVARSRELSREEKTIFICTSGCGGSSGGIVIEIGETEVVNEFERTVTTHVIPDITPGDFHGSVGGTLIGILDDQNDEPLVTGDQFGSLGSPIDPLLEPGIGYYGGFTPTVRLLPGSPAIDGVDINANPFLSFTDESQNGFPLDGLIDLGAWGADPIDSFFSTSVASAGIDPFAVSLDFGEPVFGLEPDDITVVGGEIVGEIVLGDDDKYQLSVVANSSEVSLHVLEDIAVNLYGGFNRASNTLVVPVVITEDTLAPESSVEALPPTADQLTFDVTVSANDVDGLDPQEVISGVADVDLYVATNDGPFELYETKVSQDSTQTFTFTGENETQYWFRSVARDLAGNEETEPIVADASTYVPDLTAPSTEVVAIEVINGGAHVWSVRVSGSDEGGSGLDRIRLDYVEGDGAVMTLGTFEAGLRDASGNHLIEVPFFPRIESGIDYYFTAIGIDGNGNEETKPAVSSSSFDSTRSQSGSGHFPAFLRDVDIQNGARQRSYIRNIDLRFTPASSLGAIVNSLADSDPDNDRLILEKMPAGSGGTAERVDLTGRVTRGEGMLQVDFGEAGLGGDPRSAGANGDYRFTMQLGADNSSRTFDFHRLLGDANGDGLVDRIDMMDVLAGLRTPHENADIDGDGSIDLVDRGITQRELGQSINGNANAASATALTAISPWQNPSTTEDVDNNGEVT